jgi:hypothetical protein
MPRQKTIITIIRDLVRTEIQRALSSIFGGLGVGPTVKGAKARAKPKPKNGRRRRRRRTKGTAPGAKRGRPAGSGRRRRIPTSEA